MKEYIIWYIFLYVIKFGWEIIKKNVNLNK